VSCTDTVLIPT